MKVRGGLKLFLAGILCAFFITAIRAASYLKDYDEYIEVCAKGIVTVPQDVHYVKCYGIVRKVKRLEQSLTESQGDCLCPKCCEGECYIMVSLEGGGIGFLWVYC